MKAVPTIAFSLLLLSCTAEPLSLQDEEFAVSWENPWNNAIPKGYKSFVVVLAFSDLFTVHKESGNGLYQFYDDFLNGPECSVSSYWLDNSNGAFVPSFNILMMPSECFSHELAYYGEDGETTGSDIHKAELFTEIANHCHSKLHECRGRSCYVEQDGELSSLIVIYPGYSQSSMGHATQLIWSAMWHSQYPMVLKYGGTYFHTVMTCSELSGDGQPNTGSFCHEFAHVVGLPDVYATNGSPDTLPDCYSLMCKGLYNAKGTRPPYLTCVEKDIYLGEFWDLGKIEGTSGSTIDLHPVQSGEFIRMDNGRGEYIYIEYREGTGWDKGLEPGVLVYHVDRTEESKWNLRAQINTNPVHPCYYRVKGSYPMEPRDWNGIPFGKSISVEEMGATARIRIM